VPVTLVSCEVGTGTIVAEVHGEEGAPWVILGGALATDHRLWSRQIEILAQSHRVLVYDNPGHGRSAVRAVDGPWVVGRLAEELVVVMDKLGIARSSFVGLSLGGSVGLQLALTYPNRLTRVACCCSRADSPPGYSDLWRARKKKVKAQGMQSIADETISRWFSDQTSGSVKDRNRALAREMISDTDPGGYMACATMLMDLRLRKDLGSITVPTEYVAGEHDSAIPVDTMKDLHDITPNGGFTIIPSAGHLANLDQPDVFNEWMLGWLAD